VVISHCFFFQSCEPVNGSSLPVNGPSCEPVNGSLRSTDYCVQRTLGLTCPLPCCLGKATSPIELKRMLLPIRRRRPIGGPPFSLPTPGSLSPGDCRQVPNGQRGYSEKRVLSQAKRIFRMTQRGEEAAGGATRNTRNRSWYRVNKTQDLYR